ncbi:polyprenyl diphosphate synthase [Streptomyces sp. NPDC007164]|uniref:polyprenyl diphosphate synthase n=1 Tax=Streptomyces sp. NPDC007164 TaxID=3156918 RepID=UPI0033DBAE41
MVQSQKHHRSSTQLAHYHSEPQGIVTTGTQGRVPRHLAIIPDGNRRWARRHEAPSEEALSRGTENFNAVAGWCSEIGIEVLSLWLSSPDNVTKREADAVTRALHHTGEAVQRLTTSRKYRLHPIGNLDLLPAAFAALLHTAEQETAAVTGMTVNLAAAYNGVDDLLSAAHAAFRADASAPLTPARIDTFLSTRGQPPVDLVIRTSGEERLSGFMPWQTAHSELYFTHTLRPDFDRDDLHNALASYRRRDRRHGA